MVKWILSRWVKNDQIKPASQEVRTLYEPRIPCRYWELEKHFESVEKKQCDS